MKTFVVVAGLVICVAVSLGRWLASGPQPAATPTPIRADVTPVIRADVTPVRRGVTPTPPLPPAAGDPVRVRFARGSYGATLRGDHSTVYLLWAAAGQTFTMTLTTTSKGRVSLYAPDGTPLYAQLAAGNTAAAVLPASGDYRLELRSSGPYTAGVEIR